VGEQESDSAELKHGDLITLLLVPAIMVPMTFPGRGPVWTSPLFLFGFVLPPVLLGALFCVRGLSRSWKSCLLGSLLLLGGFTPLVIFLMSFSSVLVWGTSLAHPFWLLLSMASASLQAVSQLRPEVALALPVLAIFALLIWLGHWIAGRTMSVRPLAWVAVLLVLLVATPVVVFLLEPFWLFALAEPEPEVVLYMLLRARMLNWLTPAFVILAGLLIGGAVVIIARIRAWRGEFP